MSGILDLTILLVMYAVSELISRKTHAVINTVLMISILDLLGFWFGLLPKDAFTVSGIDSLGMAIVGLMLVGLGTSISLDELKREFKVVIVAIFCALGGSCLIILVALLCRQLNYGIVGAPIFAGGNAATLILLNALRTQHLSTLMTYALAVLTFQNIIGIPIASLALRKEASRLLANGFPEDKINADKSHSQSPLHLSKNINTPIMLLAKLALVASLSYGVSLLIHGAINYLVICFILGIIFYQLGFLDEDIMNKTESNGIITFLVTVVILDSLAETSPQQVLAIMIPLLICLIVGTLGVILTAGIISKFSNVSFAMAIALGMTCTFGFPTTMIMAQEVATSIGKNPTEQAKLEKIFLPKMMIAGLVTVTLISVFFAGFAVNYLH